jgi:hypothetical protein
MNKLQGLKERFGKAVLGETETSELKGGFRYYTKSNTEFVNKVTTIAGEGNHLCWSLHDGVYCIEW